MIEAKSWVYAHIPRTAGDIVTQMARNLENKIPGCVVDNLDVPNKHDSFTERVGPDDQRRRVMTIRRLPYWILSYTEMLRSYGVHPAFKPINVPENEMTDRQIIRDPSPWYPELGNSLACIADGYLKKFGPADVYLRCECVVWDFLSFISLQEGLSRTILRSASRQAHTEVDLVKIKLKYNRNIRREFGRNLRQVYVNNPQWAALEKRIYGNIPTRSEST